MKIRIDQQATDQNRATNDKIRAALDPINGKAESFTITSWGELREFAKNAEAQLAMLPKAERKGASATCTPAGPTANCYKYSAVSTTVTIERFATGWFLVAAARSEVYPKSPERCNITITEAQRDEIQRRSVANFAVATKQAESAAA